jgi:hypothetical protein
MRPVVPVRCWYEYGLKAAFFGTVAITHIILIATVILTGLLTPGCKRHRLDASEAEATNAVPSETNAPVAPAASSRTRDLGVLQLTNHCETRIDLDGGKSCAITPHLIDAKRLQLTMVLESKMPDGKTRGLNITKVVSQPDQQFEFVFGGLSLTLTPQMAGETNLPAKTP